MFSSHVLTTLGFLDEFMDPSTGSSRHVTLQELPLVDNLSTATRELNRSLKGAREAIYYGLMPGMIFESTKMSHNIAGKRDVAIKKFLSESEDLVADFKSIVKSLTTGCLSEVHDTLHILLDTCGERGSAKVRWVPYHLECVMGRLSGKLGKLSADYCMLASELERLCEQLIDAKESSGDGWEGVFVLFLLARCIAAAPDEIFVPRQWFTESPKLYYNAPYEHAIDASVTAEIGTS